MIYKTKGAIFAVTIGLGIFTPAVRSATIGASWSRPVVVGSPFTVAVGANEFLPSDLYAFQFDLSFNPKILTLDSVAEGPFLPMYGSTFFIPGVIDNTAGSVTAVADTLVGAVQGGTGTCTNCPVTIAYLTFTPLSAGTSELAFSNVDFLDSSLNSLVTTSSAESVTVITPEPGYHLILPAGALLMFLARARRKRQDGRDCWPAGE